MKPNEITGAILSAAIEVHRALGPGLLESASHLLIRGITMVREG